ncbi:vigilin [Nephila pilipes]|uniref:Vigilin n=1 Tax=Nephila pilipes TaxID=299642 RepID=A0A8X6NGN5_NEPPI|nr:vigilin [Nephila pilipes]
MELILKKFFTRQEQELFSLIKMKMIKNTITIIGTKEEVEADKNEVNSLIAELKDTAETLTEIDPKQHRYFVTRGTTVLKQISGDYRCITVSFPKFGSNSSKVVFKGAKDFLEPAKQSLYEVSEEMVTIKCLIPQDIIVLSCVVGFGRLKDQSNPGRPSSVVRERRSRNTSSLYRCLWKQTK